MIPPIVDTAQPMRWLSYTIAGFIMTATFAIGFFFRRWWSKRVTGRSIVVRRESQLLPDSLVSIWRRFLRGQPWRHRASILEYPMVIVLGPAGAGKSKLIDTQVDWQAQKKRFFPSVTEDPLLQVYIGSRVIVQELSPALLGDDSADARRALSRLWKASAARRPPGVLLVVDALALGNAAPEELRRQSQLLRGKIDLLQELHGKQMRVSVCLTHMDGFTGFAELAQVCQRQQLPLAVDLAAVAVQRDVRQPRLFAAREEYLSLALTAAPAESFNRVVELMASSGGLGAGLSAFLSPLMEKSRLAAPPLLERLYFFSPGDQIDRAFLAPAAIAGKTTPLRQHALRLGFAAGAMLLLLGAAHWNHAHKLSDASAAVAAYQQIAARAGIASSSSELRTSLDRADSALTSLRSSESWWPLLKLSSRGHKRQLATKLVETTRAAYLLPLVRHGSIESRELTLYTLGLLYSSPDNALGQYIAPRSKHWADNLAVPETAVTSYIRWSEHAWGETVPLASPSENSDPTLSLKPWSEFLAALQAAYESQDVGEDLRQLQAQATALYEALDRSRQFSEVPALLQLLPEHTPVDINAFLSAPHRDEALAWIGDNRPTLEGLLTMIRQGELSTQVLGRMMVGALVAHVNKLLTAGASETFALKLSRSYVFGRQRWSELIARASIQVYVRQPGYPFLPREAPAAPDAQAANGALASAGTNQANPTNSATGAAGNDPYASAIASAYATGTNNAAAAANTATGNPTTDVYHRPVVEGSVRPALLEFGKLLPSSPLPAADKATLAAYMLEQANLYAQHYREALFAEYQPYHVNVRSARELPGAVTQLIQPTGGFMRWLRAVADDADLGTLDSMYLRPLGDAVAPLQPIVRLLKPPKDAGPGMGGLAPTGGLSRYVEMITRLSRDLAGTEKPSGMMASTSTFMPTPPPTPTAEAPAGSDEPGADLKTILSPVGRVAMSMLLQPDSSYTAQAAQWLEEVGITDDLKRPFLEPFDRVLDFGVPEIESALKTQWTKQWNQVSPMFGKYPFRRVATKEVDPTELDSLSERGGNFWKGFRVAEEPFCALRNGTWVARAPLARPVTLPPGMLGRVNLVAHLSHIFFDKEGKRAPLQLSATPLPLPRELDREGYVTMSFLRAGGASVFGFNQAPTARSFAPTWWNQDGASIGIMFGDPSHTGTPDRTPDRSIDTGASPWALYRLIERGKVVDDTVTWTLPGDGATRRTVPVRFVIRGNVASLRPWTLFGSGRD